MARYIKKTTTTPKRRYLKKKPKVSTAVKAYVKKATNKLKTRGILDAYAVETVQNTLGIWYMDGFMNSQAPNTEWSDRVQSFGLKVKYSIHSNSTDVPIAVRMLVIENLRGRTNTTYRAGTALFEYKDSTAANHANIDQNYNATTACLTWRINDEHFKVHYDRTIVLGISNDGSGGRNHVGQFWCPFKKVLTYDQTLGGLTLPERSNLAVLFIPIETPNDFTTGRSIEVTAVGSWYYNYTPQF